MGGPWATLHMDHGGLEPTLRYSSTTTVEQQGDKTFPDNLFSGENNQTEKVPYGLLYLPMEEKL